jgi:hypothetical protein
MFISNPISQSACNATVRCFAAESKLYADRALDIRTVHIERPKKQTKLSTKCLIAALLLIGAASTASAQYLPYRGCSSVRERGYYGTPTGGGPQYDYGGGDQYGYGPGYSYARQAPSCNSRGTSRVGAQRGQTAREKWGAANVAVGV